MKYGLNSKDKPHHPDLKIRQSSSTWKLQTCCLHINNVKDFWKNSKEYVTQLPWRQKPIQLVPTWFQAKKIFLRQLLAHVERLMSNLQNDENVDVIYLVFSKAFDRVDHAILLHKLQNIGIRGQLLNWLKSFRTEGVQKVSVNTFLSYGSQSISRVPQAGADLRGCWWCSSTPL